MDAPPNRATRRPVSYTMVYLEKSWAPVNAVTDNIRVKPQLVFVGCPWRTIRPKYERIFNKKTFKRRFPLAFVIIGRDGNQRAEDLFAEIKRQIDSASVAIFDVSGGNANVALEFGYAQGLEVPSYVFVNVHGQFARAPDVRAALISDLSGVRRNPYKNEHTLERLLRLFAEQHDYTQRVARVASKYRLSTKERATLMSIPRAFRDSERMRRADLRQRIKAETDCDDDIAEKAIEAAKKGRLIEISVGQHGYTKLKP